ASGSCSVTVWAEPGVGGSLGGTLTVGGGGQTATRTLSVVVPNPATVAVDEIYFEGENATSMQADGSATRNIAAVVRDDLGHLMPGETVNWSATLGAMSPETSVADENGVARAVFTAGTTAGTAVISAQAGSSPAKTLERPLTF